jgi:CBS domain containing-hemolysin-like protein
MSDMLFYFIAALALLLTNAFFVCAEFALVRIRLPRIEELIKNGNRQATHVKAAVEQMNAYLAAIQIGSSLACLGLGWIGQKAFADPLCKLFARLGLNAGENLPFFLTPGTLAFIIAFAAVVLSHVVIGELLPKTLAIQHTERMALTVALPLRFFQWLFRPLLFVAGILYRPLMRRFGMKDAAFHRHVFSEEELQSIVNESQKAGVFTKGQQEMLERVLKFHNKTVREIMIPCPDIIAIDVRSDPDEVVNKVFNEGFSRLPVYDGNIDNVVGIAYAKDFVHAIKNPKLIKLADLLHECHFVPETLDVAALVGQFQKNRVHLAVVVDEFGATAGLVTLEDALEEIVGEIQDEYDTETAELTMGANGVCLCEGKAHISKIEEVFPGFKAPEGSYDTVGGLVLHLAGRLPKEGETFRCEGLSFRVAKREGRRVRKLAIRKIPVEANAGTKSAPISDDGDGAPAPLPPSEKYDSAF